MDRADEIAQELAGLGLDEPLTGEALEDAPAPPESGEQAAPQVAQEAPQVPAEAAVSPSPLRTTEAQRAAAERLAGALKQLRESFDGVIEAAEVLCCALTEDETPTEVVIEEPEADSDHVVAEPEEGLLQDGDDEVAEPDDGAVVETDDKETADDAEVSEAS